MPIDDLPPINRALRILPCSASPGGVHLLCQQKNGGLRLLPTTDPLPRSQDGVLAIAPIRISVSPDKEWRQMFRESLMLHRDLFYDPGLHGLNYQTLVKAYRPYLNNVKSRDDLNYLFSEIFGQFVVSHQTVTGGDFGVQTPLNIGLLGADYEIANGHYRIAKIYRGDKWTTESTPRLKAPLADAEVKVGDYLLEIDGQTLRPDEDISSLLINKAGHEIELRLSSTSDLKESRLARVVPTESEIPLRALEWIEKSRDVADKLSGGRVGYVYLPNTSGLEADFFNRYFYAQVGKQALIVDERFNSGGSVSNYVFNALKHELMDYRTLHAGEDFPIPSLSIFGPKVLMINEESGSGEDQVAYHFRALKIGPLVGKRTWGGLVGFSIPYPNLIDGGRVTLPSRGFYSPEGSWDVENRGVAPDFEVEWEPKFARDDRDSQLEKAVAVALDRLKANPLPHPPRPSYPRYRREPFVHLDDEKDGSSSHESH